MGGPLRIGSATTASIKGVVSGGGAVNTPTARQTRQEQFFHRGTAMMMKRSKGSEGLEVGHQIAFLGLGEAVAGHGVAQGALSIRGLLVSGFEAKQFFE